MEAVSRVQAKEMKCPLLNILISEEEGAQRGPISAANHSRCNILRNAPLPVVLLDQ